MSSLEFQLSSADQKVSRLQQSHGEELQGTLLKLKEKEKMYRTVYSYINIKYIFVELPI